ncbi:MAG TPA: aldehyde dehydrogenase family protein, partial [Solirubrobacteraceae bacterium]|nr:aldehyde dehydrogenase family protein [Solirubrobacteraceae bacterium]
ELVADARAAQPAWADGGLAARAAPLDRLRRWLLDHSDRVLETLGAETGKAYEDALFLELAYVVSALRFWSARAGSWLADERRLARSPLVPGRRLVTRHRAHGLVVVIGPWNYPLINSFGDCIPALLAGNSVILKPSELTPLSSLLIAEALAECGLPSGVFAVAPGDGATAASLIDEADFVMFTGSIETGRKVAEQAARRLIPCALELGGKDALVVLAGADLERAANCAAHYAMLNAGQTCVSIERAYVQDEVYDEFTGLLAERIGALRTGPPAGPGSVDVGAITAPAQLELIERHVADARERGARIVTGGSPVAGPGRFFQPTLILDADHTMACMTEETFGPVLAVMRVASADEAVERVNDTRYGLGAAVFAASLEQGRALAGRLAVGAVCVNDAAINYFALEAPMGGTKQSGLGVRHGPEGIRKFTRPQTILLTPRWFPRREPHMQPYSKRRTALLARALRTVYRRGPSN